MKKISILLIRFIFLFGGVNWVMADALEWSDIDYIQGKYSRIYFDYIQGVGSQNGTFYVINDWIVNQEDGGVNGGLNPDEYNLFTFDLGSDDYEIHIFGDGNADIFLNGINDSLALLNFKSATSWTTSPNEPAINHTIWEFSFDVEPMKVTNFIGCDPPCPITVYYNPPPPSVITNGPSQYTHYIDGEFSDSELTPTIPPDPSSPYRDPVVDPWFNNLTFDITLLEGGGTTTEPVPEPATATMFLFASGIIGLARYRRKISKN